MTSLGWRACVFSVALGTTSIAGAQNDSGEKAPPEADPTGARGAVDKGAFLGWNENARLDGHRATADLHSGYDTSFGSMVGTGRAQAVFLPVRRNPRTGKDLGLALRAAGTWTQVEDTATGELGVQAHFLFRKDAGVDLAGAVSYQNEGFNLRPAVSTMLLASTELGPISLHSTLAYGHGLLDEERYGRAGFAMLGRALPDLRVGIDSRVLLDLEYDDNEPSGEPEVLFQAGPVATYALGPVALGAQGGVSVLKLRFGQPEVGAVALAGIGGAF